MSAGRWEIGTLLAIFAAVLTGVFWLVSAFWTWDERVDRIGDAFIEQEFRDTTVCEILRDEWMSDRARALDCEKAELPRQWRQGIR